MKRQQRERFQVSDERGQPNTTDAYRGGDVHPVEVKLGWIKGRRYDPENIQPMHEKDYRSDLRQGPSAPLGGPREQQDERESKQKQNQSERNPLPSTTGSMQVPGDLLSQIFRPNQQKLREMHIGPKHDESEEKVAEIVKTVRRVHLGKKLFVFDPIRNHNHERQSRQPIAHYEDHAEDRRVPFGLEGHHPIDGRESYGQPVEHKTRSAQALQSLAQSAVTRAVLLK